MGKEREGRSAQCASMLLADVADGGHCEFNVLSATVSTPLGLPSQSI